MNCFSIDENEPINILANLAEKVEPSAGFCSERNDVAYGISGTSEIIQQTSQIFSQPFPSDFSILLTFKLSNGKKLSE